MDQNGSSEVLQITLMTILNRIARHTKENPQIEILGMNEYRFPLLVNENIVSGPKHFVQTKVST